ncbi:MAG: helix-turn-helix transcriptional regulator [Spartobacteria bacterium]
MLKLQAATTIDCYWEATQALVAAAAPSSNRWLCVRPLQMKTAMMLLRETDPARGRRRSGRKKNGHSEEGADEAVLLAELFARHPAPLHFRRNPETLFMHLKPKETLPVCHGGNGLLQDCDWVCCAALAFSRQKRIQGLLLLHRTENEGDFSATELQTLRDLHPYLETALCRVIAVGRQHAQKNLLAGVLKPLPLPLVLCDWQLNIICESAAGLEGRVGWELGKDCARVYNLSRRRALPPDLAEFCRLRIKAWEKADPARRAALEKEESEQRHPLAPRLRATIRMIRERNFPLIRPLFLLRFEPQRADGPAARSAQIVSDNFVSLAQLSVCERELALLVCGGHSNAGISRNLGKSVYTIKAQLHSIFEKLQVKSRSKLIALLLRTSLYLLPCSSFDLFDALISGV